MKTTREVYDQRGRCYQMAMRIAADRAKAACPSTGGNACLAHNWQAWGSRPECAPGATEAARIWRTADARWNEIGRRFDAAYDLAEHRTHGPHFKPLWCTHCKAEAAAA